MQKGEILCVIPARGGSKGIPKKNIRAFAGKPLIVHSIEAAKNAPSVRRIIVSTDSEEIAQVARDTGAEVPFLRPSNLAEDTTKMVDVIEHLLAELKSKEDYVPEQILLLQPTSPMRTSEDIENAVELLQKENGDSLVSVCRTENLLLTKNGSDQLTILNADLLKETNRQQLPDYFKLDGCTIYLVNTETFLKERSFFGGKLIGYEIPRWRAVDLDEPQDFILGELIYKAREKLSKDIEEFK